MKNDFNKYLAKPNGTFSLKHYNTTYNGNLQKEKSQQLLKEMKVQLIKLQEVLYASDKYSVLILFQAMDAAGKDSAIKHVMSGLNPQGCEVYSFKTPSNEEYSHDFLWRHYKALPERGKIGIHNRSHYENVLVCKVHPEYILNENIPAYADINSIDADFWKDRYESIRNFEKHLTENGTVILKFFLHVSKDEQKQRFLDRINDPEKNWKFSAGDLKERELWKNYMDAYEKAIKETSTKNAPWYIIPADKKWYTRLAISKIITEKIKDLALEFPTLPKEEFAELENIKQQLLNDK